MNLNKYNKFQKIIVPKGKMRIAIYFILILILSILIYLTYNEYKNTIVNQQQKTMLESSRSISRSIELFIEDVQDGMRVITLDKDLTENRNAYGSRLKAYCEAQGKVVTAAYFLDEKGKVIEQYPQNIKNIIDADESDIKNVIATGKTSIGKAHFNENKDYFVLSIYEPIYDDEKLKGIFLVVIRLDMIYEAFIAPVKIGEKGYALVKDQDGTIIMHTVKEQVGMNVIESRKQIYPNLEYEELERLISDQLKGQEGTAIYHSYWWGENELKKAKKLNAYTPVKFGNQFWIVALTMSYDEIQEPINKFLGIIVAVASLVAVIIYAFVLAIIKIKRNKDELEQETKYLKMLNEASEELRKKEAEMYHSHKLKMIGTLAGGIAHDINNLLTPILGYSELLLMNIEKDSENYADVEEIYKASIKGKDLIEQILLFSRNDNGILKMEPVDMNEVTRETIRLLKSVLPKNVVIKEDIRIDYGYVKANFTQMHQVIFNLCTNAYQSIRDKNGEVKVSLNRIRGEDAHKISASLKKEIEYIELRVLDNGCGMDEETKRRIFDPFFTTKDIGQGTGLGLFVVQSIIDKYDGIIIVESEVGIGSCFKVYLPCLPQEAPVEGKRSFLKGFGNNKKILVVDDNKDVLKVLKKGLQKLGYKVTTEDNCKAILQKFEKEYSLFDMVITDYMMPEIKGDEIAVRIKEIKKDVKVILMTGYMEDSKKDIKCCECIDAFVQKPIEINELSEIIKNLLI